MINSQQTIPDLLLAALSQAPPPNFAERIARSSVEEWTQLLALATEQQVAALLYHRLKAHHCEDLLPDFARQQLQKSHRANALRNLQIYHALGQLVGALQAQQIPVIVLKGAHLAAAIYPSIALRMMVDIDILVPEVHLSTAVAQIEALGYHAEHSQEDLDAYLDYRHHLPPFLHPKGVAAVELHWRITRPKRAYTIPMDELWQRRKPVTLHGVVIYGFCPEDLLLHLCMHATYHHWFQNGIRSLCDIAELVERHKEELDWDAIITRASLWEWQRGVFLALSAAAQLLGVDIPPTVLTRLNPTQLAPFTPTELYTLLFPEDRTVIIAPGSHFWRFLKNPTLASGIRLLHERLWISPDEMAVMYGIAANSPRRYFYYGVRLYDLLGRFTRKAWRIYWGDQQMTTMILDRERLQSWLEQPESL